MLAMADLESALTVDTDRPGVGACSARISVKRNGGMNGMANKEKKCKNCNYWKIPRYGEITDSHGNVSLTRECTCPKIKSYGDDVELAENDGALLTYEVVTLQTGPEFGCIHWEQFHFGHRTADE
jgi:hypothetical protein